MDVHLEVDGLVDMPDLKIEITFFFSSRRRHTRLQGDWSSDVCSSDLAWCSRDRASSSITSPAAVNCTRRRSEEHTSELQSPCNLVCRLLLEKKKIYQHMQLTMTHHHISIYTTPRHAIPHSNSRHYYGV